MIIQWGWGWRASRAVHILNLLELQAVQFWKNKTTFTFSIFPTFGIKKPVNFFALDGTTAWKCRHIFACLVGPKNPKNKLIILMLILVCSIHSWCHSDKRNIVMLFLEYHFWWSISVVLCWPKKLIELSPPGETKTRPDK